MRLQAGRLGCVLRPPWYSERMQTRLAIVDVRPSTVASLPCPACPRSRTPVEIRPHVRLLHGMRRPANWLQLVRFGIVGGVGFVVNLAVYTLFVHALGVDYRAASVIAWLVAVANNFVLNRHWTFDARDGRAHFQAMRFLLVSLAAEAFSLLMLTAVRRGRAASPRCPPRRSPSRPSTPLNFLGNKLWSFRARR